jgi:hypothetical protein
VLSSDNALPGSKHIGFGSDSSSPSPSSSPCDESFFLLALEIGTQKLIGKGRSQLAIEPSWTKIFYFLSFFIKSTLKSLQGRGTKTSTLNVKEKQNNTEWMEVGIHVESTDNPTTQVMREFRHLFGATKSLITTLFTAINFNYQFDTGDRL